MAQLTSQNAPRMRWWQTAVVYQIYPRSFADSNRDGVGDLRGIIDRLEYVEWLGVDAIWLSPFYRSPMADFGYDISDHKDVDPLFGTLDDFDALLDEAHRRNVRVIVDYVPNHTSDQHQWFQRSRSSRDDRQRDWYVWRDARPDGEPPNNWLSMFGGPAWEWDEQTGQFYLHSFLQEQPDLNWRNPEVHAAMLDVLRFWLDRGVDGFRIDVVPFIGKDPELRDNPPSTRPEEFRHLGAWSYQMHLYDLGHRDLHPIYREIRRLVDSYPGDRVTIGELHDPDLGVWAGYYGADLDEIHIPFNFHLMNAPWTAASVDRIATDVIAALPTGAWANWVLGNHDQPRIASRIGPDQAAVAMTLLLTLPGTPTLYYGDEIGMVNGVIPSDRTRDPWALTEPQQSRDPERTPMPWDGTGNAGFADEDVVPWLPLAGDWQRVNVAAQRDDSRSLLTWTRTLIALRRENAALARGRYVPLGPTPDEVFAFVRSCDGASDVIVALNLSGSHAAFSVERDATTLASSHSERSSSSRARTIELAPNEALIAVLADS